MRLITFEGSHGSLTCCAISGHIVECDDCPCEDCQRLGSYRAIALVDIAGTHPEAVQNGCGDIMAAAVIMRSGAHCPAAQLVDDCGGALWQDLRALPAPTCDTEREIEVSLYAFANDSDGSRPIEPGETPDGYCVYVMDRNALGDGWHDEISDADYPTLAAAVRAFDAQMQAFPNASENVYCMPHPGLVDA